MLAEHLGDVSLIHLKVDGLDRLLNAKVGSGHANCNAGQTVGLLAQASQALAYGADARLMA